MQGACSLGRGNAVRGVVQVLAMVVVTLSLCASKAVLGATTYKVGDDSGWDIMSYDSWVAGKTFMEGDILEFVYSNAHDVVEVNAANYAACAKGSNTGFSDGDTKYTLSGVGSKYYICSVSNHCSRGMKVSIAVVAAATTPTSSPTPTTNTTTPTTPTTPSTTPSTPSSPNTTTTPPPSSSPLSLPPSILTLFIILGLTLIFFHSY